jgi:hypothetical protein
MGKLILDAALRAKLASLQGATELCDDEGRTVGYFMDAEAYRKMLYTNAAEMFSDEELEEARREPGGLTTEEVLAQLKQVRAARGN